MVGYPSDFLWAVGTPLLYHQLGKTCQICVCLFVWSFTAQSTLLRSCYAGQLTYSHFSWAGLEPTQLTSISAHSSPVTDNCPT